MATYPPPTENLPIFDNEVFITGDEPLTYNIAKKKFLRYPTAQGKETLQEIVVNGIADFNQDVTDYANHYTIGDEVVDGSTVLNGTLRVFGISTLAKTGIASTDTNALLSVTYQIPNSFTNNGIVMNNAGITQQGLYINSITNNLGQTTITKSGTGAILSVNFDNSAGGIFNSNALTMTNAGILQTGSQITGVTNTLTSTKLINGSGLTLDWGSTLFINANATPASANYRLGTQSGLNLKLNYYTTASGSGVTTELISFNQAAGIAITPPITNSSTMPASSDSSTRVPTTAWVQSAITASAGGSNLTKNSYTTVPTSISVVNTTGITNYWNTGGKIGYASSGNVNLNVGSVTSVGKCCSKPLYINIQSINGLWPNGPSQHTPTFSPLLAPIKVKFDCFMFDSVANRTGYTRGTIMILPSACFSISNNAFEGWGCQNSNPVNETYLAYALDGRINGNTSFNYINTTYAPYPVVTQPTSSPPGTGVNPTPSPVPYPSSTGRQFYTYDYSSSSAGISVVGMLQTGAGITQIAIWFSGLSDPKNDPNNNTSYVISAEIVDAYGATQNTSTPSAVFLS